MPAFVQPCRDVALWREIIVGLSAEACGGEDGRSKDEPRYLEVVEDRDVGATRKVYSSCADQAHWAYFRIGIREKWINRDENRAATGVPWVESVNVSRLAWSPIATDFGKTAQAPPPEPGDVLILWTDNPAPKKKLGDDAHVCLVHPGAPPGFLRIANYGAGGMRMESIPGANITQPRFQLTKQGWMFGNAAPQQKRLQRILRVSSLMPLLTARPNLEGARLHALGEYCDRVGDLLTPTL